MIKTQDLVPDIYYNESRDFQLFGRLYDVVFNYLKTNIDLINNRKDSKLLELLLCTLGFQSKRQYNYNDLYLLSQTFINIMRNKGNVEGIDKAIKTILHAENIKSKYEIILTTENNLKIVTIYINDDINNSEIVLLEEILDYILPIGTIYNIKTAQLRDLTQGKLVTKEAAKLSKLDSTQTSAIIRDEDDFINENINPIIYENEGLELNEYNINVSDLSLGTVIRDEDSDE